jgi:hypothetical protein
MTMPVDPLLSIQSVAGGGVYVTAQVKFEDFDMGLRFTSMVVDFLNEALAAARLPAATGLFAGLSPEQQAAALEYVDADHVGDPALARSSTTHSIKED